MADNRVRINKAFGRWFKVALTVTMDHIKSNYLSGPWPEKLDEKTGELKRTLQGKVLEDGFSVGTNKKQGIYWEFGTRSRTIVARPGSVLAIRIGRPTPLMLFRKSVFVPQQPPRKWLEPGFREALPMVMKAGTEIMTVELSLMFPDRTVTM